MSPWHLDPIYMAGRLMLALILGGLIGFERERNSSAAGFRTHILVCLGSALIMLLSAHGFPEFAKQPGVNMDPARLAAQVISGIGFLGAGTILRNGLSITGLTTAASLWVVAAIGLAAGAGFYFPAILCTIMVLLSLWMLNAVEKRFFSSKRVYLLKIHATRTHGVLNEISSLLERQGVVIIRLSTEEDDRNENNVDLRITMSVKLPKGMKALLLADEIRELKNISGVYVEYGA
jgi:putative Mg2+ transporter-C (MgtC) family protein